MITTGNEAAIIVFILFLRHYLYMSFANSINNVPIRIMPTPIQRMMSSQFIYLVFGLVTSCRLHKKYSLKNK